MTKAPTTSHGKLVHLSHRVTEATKQALERRAAEDSRPVAEILHNIILGEAPDDPQ